jgi:hypothetical protein
MHLDLFIILLGNTHRGNFRLTIIIIIIKSNIATVLLIQ